jgi:calcium-dependent protein kinase
MPSVKAYKTNSAPPSVTRLRQARTTGTKARGEPNKRGVGRNHTFKFRSSTFVTQRKSKSIEDYYELKQELNEGAYGVVYKAIHKESGAERAVKKIEKSKWNPEENQKVIDEFNVLKGLDHPNILKMYELFEEEKHFYIVTDICKGGDLLDELEAMEETGCFPEAEAAILMNQVLSSVNYCHKNNFVHRDLKPENILLEQNKALHEIKLIDFGFAVPCDEHHTMREQKGTAAYMSPQAMLEEPYGQKTDVWAVGVIAYIVLAGFNPFEGHTDQETAVLVEMGEFELDIPEWETISKEAKDFVSKCLAYEEKDRLTAAQALEHPWVRKCRSNINSEYYKSAAIQCVDAMTNLQKFHAQSKLKQATCTFIASQLVSKEEKESIDKLFRSMDTDSDGKLGRPEVQVGYKSIFGHDFDKDELEKLFQEVDMNGDGIIEYSEFVVAAMDEELLLSTNNLRKAFEMFDHDGDGQISRADLVEVMKSFGGGVQIEDVIIDKIMNQVDINSTGTVDFEQFKESMFKNTTIPESMSVEDEEDDEMNRALEEARRLADEFSNDGASSSSSKKINAKKALQIPRRRSSATEMAVAVLAEGMLNSSLTMPRTLSGSSDVSALSGGSEEDHDNGGRARKVPNAEVNRTNSRESRPALKPAAKKSITRTKSGFMTQRAEPTTEQRKGKKPIKPEIIPPPPAKKSVKPEIMPPPPVKNHDEPMAPRESAIRATTSPKKSSPVAKTAKPEKIMKPAKLATAQKIEKPVTPTAPEKIEKPVTPTTLEKIEKPVKPTAPEKIQNPVKSKPKDQADKPAKAAKAEPLKRSVSESSASSASSSSSSSSGSSSGSSSSSSNENEAENTELHRAKKEEPLPAKVVVPEKQAEVTATEVETPPQKRNSASKATNAIPSHAAAAPRNLGTTNKIVKETSSHAFKPKPTTPDAATSSTPDESAAAATPPEEKKSEQLPIEDCGKRIDRVQKKIANRLGDMLSDLPSSSHYKKQQRHKNPNSSSVSVPAIPTHDSIQQPTEASTEEFHQQPRRPSTGAAPAPSIRDRMNVFKGTGGGVKTIFPTNKGRLSAGRINSPVARDGRLPDSGEDGKPVLHKQVSTGVIPSASPLLVSKPKVKLGDSVPDLFADNNIFQEPIARKQNANGSRVDDDANMASGDLNSVEASELSADGVSNARSSLKNRMTIFEQNIEKNKAKGTVKKSLW